MNGLKRDSHLLKQFVLFASVRALFSFLRYLNFCHDIFGRVRKRLNKKEKLILKFMASKPGRQTFTIIYCSISQEVRQIRERNLVS